MIQKGMGMSHRLRFAPEILIRLGEELVPHADLGIMELVRNAYDADAAKCHLALTDAAGPHGTLVVSDDGDGMTADQLATGFLLIGKSTKSSSPHTSGGRRRVGEKGLGRLAALRMGRSVTITTRSRSQRGIQHRLTIDWDKIDASDAVEDVPLSITSSSSSEPPGTEVMINGLRQPLNSRDAERLARSLVLLSGPFPDNTAFMITCDAPEFSLLSSIFNRPLLEWYEYKLECILDSEGKASAKLINWRGEEEFKGSHDQVAVPRTGRKRLPPVLAYSAPPAKFELWMFNLNPGASREVRRVGQDTEALKRWLKPVGGIHLYHRGLRVQPYGDAGNDWLGINLRRAASPEVRPSTNNSVGRIKIDDPGNLLIPKTDRSGFVDTASFVDIQEFAKNCLEWAADQRLQKREQRRVGASKKARDRVKDAEEKFQNLLDAINPTDSDLLPLDSGDTAILASFSETASEVFTTLHDENQALREDLLLYRSLATVGTSTAVFAHEALKPAKRIINDIKTIGRRIRRRIEEPDYNREFRDPIDGSIESAKTLETFAMLPLSLLEKRKRRVNHVEIDAACRAIASIFQRYLEERNISVEYNLSAPGVRVHTTVADIESILSNLLANAAHAFTREDARSDSRVIRISTTPQSYGSISGVSITVDDSGPGIQGLSLSTIWLPGRTTRENGTGLGLTIVRDIVADLKGTQEATRHGDLGGAKIVIWLPSSVN